MNTDVTIALNIPVYNEEQFIAETLDSVMENYDYLDEIFITNNASTDGTLDICKRYAHGHPKIKILMREKKVNVWENYFTALRYIKSRYYMGIGGHDIFSPDYFRVIRETLSDNPNAIATVATTASFEGAFRDHNFTKTNMEKKLIFTLPHENVAEKIDILLQDYGLFKDVAQTELYRECSKKYRYEFVNFDYLIRMHIVMSGKPCLAASQAVFYARDTHPHEMLQHRIDRTKNNELLPERNVNPHWYIANEYWNSCLEYAPYICTKKLKRRIALWTRNQFLSHFTDEGWRRFSIPGAMEDYITRSGRQLFLFGVTPFALKFYEVLRDKVHISGIADPANAGWMTGQTDRYMAVIALPDSAESYTLMDRLEDMGFTYGENYWLASDFATWRSFLQTQEH